VLANHRYKADDLRNPELDWVKPAGGFHAALGLPRLTVVLANGRYKILDIEMQRAARRARPKRTAAWTCRGRRRLTVVLANRRYRILDIGMRRAGSGAPGPSGRQRGPVQPRTRLGEAGRRVRC